MVFWSYLIYMFVYRYQGCKSYVKYLTITIAVIFNLITAFGLVLTGQHLFIHIIVSWVYGCLYILALIKLEAWIHSTMTKIGFDLNETKRKVFHMFFFSLALIILGVIIVNSIESLSEIHVDWIV